VRESVCPLDDGIDAMTLGFDDARSWKSCVAVRIFSICGLISAIFLSAAL
jgi:hypothetical protein